MKAGDAVAPALVVMTLGLWMSAEMMALPWFDTEVMWPLLIATAGICFLIGYLVGGGPWQFFLGVMATGDGLILFLFTSGVWPWSLLTQVWPLFLVIAGCACLGYMVASPGAPWPLAVPGLGAVLTGSTGLLFSLGVVPLDPIQQLRTLWPMLLVLTGFFGLMQAIWHGVSGRR